jgi:hypothetical protein
MRTPPFPVGVDGGWGAASGARSAEALLERHPNRRNRLGIHNVGLM